MIMKFKSFIRAGCHSFGVVCAVAVVLHFGVLAGSAQIYTYSGSETTINLNPGLYVITAYGAQGGGSSYFGSVGGLGAEMSGEFNFPASTTLTLLVGGTGGYGFGGGGGGQSSSGSAGLSNDTHAAWSNSLSSNPKDLASLRSRRSR